MLPVQPDASEYCDAACRIDEAPFIPLDAVKPTHPWAKKLYAWIRQRLDAGESLVK